MALALREYPLRYFEMGAEPSRGLLHDIGAVLGSRVAVLFFTVATSIVIARLLGPEGKGAISALLVYPTLMVSLAEFGIRQVVVLEVGRKVYSQSQVIGATLFLYVVNSVLGVAVVVIALTEISKSSFAAEYVLIAALLVPIQLAHKYASGVVLGSNKIAAFSFVTWLAPFATLVFTLVLVWLFRLSVLGALLSAVLGSVVVAVCTVYFVLNIVRSNPQLDFGLVISMLKLGFGYGAALFVMSLNYRIDIAMLERLRTIGEVGQYSVGVNLAELIWQVPAAIGVVVFARSAASRGSLEFSRAVARLYRVALVVSILVSLLIATLGPTVIQIFYGRDFTPAAEAMTFLLPGIVAMIAHKVLNMDLAGRGKPYAALFSFLPALLANILLNLLFIPAWGANGAAVASSISYTLAAVLFLFQYRQVTTLRLREVFAYSKADFDFLPRLAGQLISRRAR